MSDEIDPDSLRKRVSELEEIVQSQQQTIAKMLPGRRGVLKGAGLLTGGALAGAAATERASAQAAGTVGTSSEPVNLNAWDLDVANEVASSLPMGGNDLTNVGALDADSINSPDIGKKVTQDNINNLSLYEGDRVTVSADSYQTIFDVADTVDVIGGVVLSGRIGELRITWGDGTTDSIPFTIDAQGDTQSGNEQYSTLPINEIVGASKLEFFNDSAGSRDFGWRVVAQ